MDTANDYRFKMAEYAVGLLERRVKQWGMPWPLNKGRAIELVGEARRLVKRLRYSFLPPEMLVESDEMRRLLEVAGELRGLIVPAQLPKLDTSRYLAFAEMRWALSILLGLPARLRLGPINRPEYAVDIVGVEVTRVEPLPGFERLRLTRASAGRFAFTIVTNIADISRGEVRAAALLPPAVFGDVVSEAMYASDPLPREYLGRRVPRRLLHGEVAAQVVRLTEKIR